MLVRGTHMQGRRYRDGLSEGDRLALRPPHIAVRAPGTSGVTENTYSDAAGSLELSRR